MDVDLLAVVLGSFLFHNVLYQLIPTSDSDIPGAKSRHVSTFHAVVGVLSSTLFYLTQPAPIWDGAFILWNPTEGIAVKWITYTCAYALGYFLYDFPLLFIHPTLRDTGTQIHHLIMITCFFGGLYFQTVSTIHFLCLMEELSTPFLNIRWSYRNHKHTLMYKLGETMFFLTFFVVRILFGLFWTYVIYTDLLPIMWASNMSAPGKIHILYQMALFTLSRFLNIFWMYKIFRIILRKSGGSGKPAEKSS